MPDTEKPETPSQSQKEEKQEGIQFLQIASIFFNQGAMALGAMPNPITGELYVSFESVQDSIGILEVLKEKTEGNLSEEESKAITGMIDELKLAFVHAVQDPQVRALAEKCKQAASGKTPEEPSKIITPDGRPASSAESDPKIILPGSGV